MVCAEHNTASEIILDAPDGTLRGDVGHMEPCFGPFGDSVVSEQDSCMVCAKHTAGSEIIFDTPDGTPR
jgi:hypothetical protein